MQLFFALLLCLRLLSVLGAQREGAQAGSPVEQVLQLLKKLREKIGQDHEVEQKVYDRYACWCDETLGRSAKAINRDDSNMRQESQEILGDRAGVNVNRALANEAHETIDHNHMTEEERTALRQQENGRFQDETTELKQALSAVAKALQSLKTATAKAPQSFLQARTEARMRAAAATKGVLEALPTTADVEPHQLELLDAYSKADDAYAPQSDTVQGILGDMYGTFARQLQQASEREAAANRDFESFIHSKEEHNTVMDVVEQEKTAKKVESKEELAEDTVQYDQTDQDKESDTGFFDATKAACMEKYHEWMRRSAVRDQELEAINKAIEILSARDARQVFGKAFSLVQLGSEDWASAGVAKAYGALKAQARKTHNLRQGLGFLALQLRTGGPFDEVIKGIDEMVVTLRQEERSDEEKKDQCKEERHFLESASAELRSKIERKQVRIEKLEGALGDLHAEKAEVVEERDHVRQEMEGMKAQREADHQDFRHEMEERERAISLLHAAQKALQAYYDDPRRRQGRSLVQAEHGQAAGSRQPPETRFSNTTRHKSEAEGIGALMMVIVKDVEEDMDGLKQDEAASVADFEKSMKASEKLEANLGAKIASLEEFIAARSREKAEEGEAKRNLLQDLEEKAKRFELLQKDCGWLLEHFDERRTRRLAELDGLQGAKEYLAGAHGP